MTALKKQAAILLLLFAFTIVGCSGDDYKDDSKTDGDTEKSDSDTTTPADGDKETTPADGDTTPADGDTPPADGDETTPTDGDETTPTDGDTETTPADGDTETTPADGDTETTPADGDTETTETSEVDTEVEAEVEEEAVVHTMMFSTTACPTVPNTYGHITGVVYDTDPKIVTAGKVTLGGTTRIADGELNGYGNFYLCNVPDGTKVSLTVHPSVTNTDYTTASSVVSAVGGQITLANFKVKSITKVTFNTSDLTGAAKEIESPEKDAKVTFPQSTAFKNQDDSAYTGTVNMAVQNFDAGTKEGLDSFPGEFMGKDGDTVTPIISVGFVFGGLTDDAGNPLKFSNSRGGAELKFELTNPNIPGGVGTDIPMWYYDEDLGIWVREGTATITNSRKEGRGTIQEITATVGHFSWWNADKPVSRTDCIKGVVQDGQGNKLEGINVQGVQHGSGISAADGSFCFNFLADASFDIVASAYNNGAYWTNLQSVKYNDTHTAGQTCDTDLSKCYEMTTPIVMGAYNVSGSCMDIELVSYDVDGDYVEAELEEIDKVIGERRAGDIPAKGKVTIKDCNRNMTIFEDSLDDLTDLCLGVPSNTPINIIIESDGNGGTDETYYNCQPYALNDVLIEFPEFKRTKKYGCVDTMETSSTCGVDTCDKLTMRCYSE